MTLHTVFGEDEKVEVMKYIAHSFLGNKYLQVLEHFLYTLLYWEPCKNVIVSHEMRLWKAG